jgi:hypothetical protein
MQNTNRVIFETNFSSNEPIMVFFCCLAQNKSPRVDQLKLCCTDNFLFIKARWGAYHVLYI